MPVSDELKNLRKKDYLSKSDKGEDGMDSGIQNSTPRIIALTDDEKKSFESAKPGEDLACEVHGTLESDGKFRVMSVSPTGLSAEKGEDDMATQVAQRVSPTIQPSPSA
jgi:hypothetical protein